MDNKPNLCPFKWWDKKQKAAPQYYPGGHPYHLCIKHREHANSDTSHWCSCGAST